jgi:N-acetylneuraminate synthase
MKKGEVISVTDLETKKPADKGIPAGDFKGVIGRKVKEDLPANSFLTNKDID